MDNRSMAAARIDKVSMDSLRPEAKHIVAITTRHRLRHTSSFAVLTRMRLHLYDDYDVDYGYLPTTTTITTATTASTTTTTRTRTTTDIVSTPTYDYDCYTADTTTTNNNSNNNTTATPTTTTVLRRPLLLRCRRAATAKSTAMCWHMRSARSSRPNTARARPSRRARPHQLSVEARVSCAVGQTADCRWSMHRSAALRCLAGGHHLCPCCDSFLFRGAPTDPHLVD